MKGPARSVRGTSWRHRRRRARLLDHGFPPKVPNTSASQNGTANAAPIWDPITDYLSQNHSEAFRRTHKFFDRGMLTASIDDFKVESNQMHNNRAPKWRRWFAWYPVVVTSVGSVPYRAWFVFVERKWSSGEYTGAGKWRYRRAGASPKSIEDDTAPAN